MKANATTSNTAASIQVQRNGCVALIRPTPKNGATYFVVDYRPNGKRKLIWRSSLEAARTAANDALDAIARGEAAVAEMRVSDCNFYVRAQESLTGTGKAVDVACLEYAAALKLLAGKTTVEDACRAWIKTNSTTLPKISVAGAVAAVQAQSVADKKSPARRHELEVLLNAFTESFNGQVHAVTPSQVSSYLSSLKRSDKSGLPLSSRSKRNHRDAIKHLNRWGVLHGYLPKDMDWLEGVQNYPKRRGGDISIYTPEEMRLILQAAAATPTRARWMVAFCAISAFSTIRHSEIKRLDWQQVELSEKPGESFIEILPVETTKSAGRRRLIPIGENLKAWLKTCRQESGKVVPVEDSYTLLSRLIKSAGVVVKANALRHSSISYSIAQTGDKARVADESGNSVKVIETNYLRRVKPAQAAAWFNILPKTAKTFAAGSL